MLKASLSNKNVVKRFSSLAIVIAAAAMLFAACAPYQGRGPYVHYRTKGEASWYGPGFAGKKTASGERFNPKALTAAHRTLPLGTMVQVTNLSNEKSVVVRINDRGPYADNRIIDLSKKAAEKIGLLATGTGRVEVVALAPNSTKAKKSLDEGVEADDNNNDAEEAQATVADDHRRNGRTLLAANRGSRKGEKPVTRNGVEYLISVEKAGEPTYEVRDSKPARGSKGKAEKAQVDGKSYTITDVGATKKPAALKKIMPDEATRGDEVADEINEQPKSKQPNRGNLKKEIKSEDAQDAAVDKLDSDDDISSIAAPENRKPAKVALKKTGESEKKPLKKEVSALPARKTTVSPASTSVDDEEF